jgi:hypothetical protein
MADEFAGVWVSGRRWVTRWPDTRLLPSGCPDYVLIEDPSHQRDQEVRDLFIRCEKSSVHGGKTQAGSWVFYRTGAF